jgi:hypothetical protein
MGKIYKEMMFLDFKIKANKELCIANKITGPPSCYIWAFINSFCHDQINISVGWFLIFMKNLQFLFFKKIDNNFSFGFSSTKKNGTPNLVLGKKIICVLFLVLILEI